MPNRQKAPVAPMTEQSATTNGHASDTKSKSDTKPKSALTLLLESIKGQKTPNASDTKATKSAFVKAMGERAKLQAALDAFDASANVTAINMVKCFGAQHVTVGGVRYVPTSRGERVYYKKMSDQTNTVNLDD